MCMYVLATKKPARHPLTVIYIRWLSPTPNYCSIHVSGIIRDPWFTDVLQSFSLLFISPQTSMSAWIPPKTHALIVASTRTTASLVAVHQAPPWLQMASAVEVHTPIVSTFYRLFNSYLCTPNALN